MPVVFPVLIPFLVLIVAVGVLSLHQSLNMWLRPLLDGMAHPKGNFLQRVAAAPVATLARGLLWIEQHVRSALSHYWDAHARGVGRWLNGHASRVEHQAKEQAALAEATADSLGYLRHRTVPRVAKSAAAPALERAKVANRTARRSISLTRRETNARRRSIDRLRKWALPAVLGFAGIDAFVKGRHASEHHRQHTRDIPRIRDRDIPRLKARDRAQTKENARTRSRLKRIEKALSLGVLGALMYRILARVAPWLFCRNWKVLGRAVCGMRPDSLAALISLLVGAWALSDLRRTAQLAEDALDFVTGLAWDAANVGERPRGRFTVE